MGKALPDDHEEVEVGSWTRYLGFAVGFAFAVVWMTVGLGSAIVCLLLASLGYCAVFIAERAQANASAPRPDGTSVEDELHLPPDGFDLDHEQYYEPSDEPVDEPADDATTPLTAEADYGWPVEGEQVHASVASERTT
jgi:uncharacterized membrane protein